MNSFQYMILGGGMVAGYAAKEFVKRGLKVEDLAVVSSEEALPYERPPLSKGFLAGKDTEEGILINNAAFYREHGIDVRLNAVVERVDLQSRTLRTRNGEVFRFEKLLIATGARPRTFDVAGAELDGILYLRSLGDSKRIRARSGGASHAVVIGAGFIAMEVSSVLAQQGVAITMAFPEDRVWKRLFTPEISDYFRRYYEARGVSFATGSAVSGFVGRGRVENVLLGAGRQLPADLVVAGIGAVPATELFEGTGLTLSNGVVVNEYLETNVPGVWAAGDVANYRDVLFGNERRVEHWDNAVKQGQHAARVMTGAREPFENVPYFFSDIFDLSWEFWGDAAEAGSAVTRGDFSKDSFSVWWLKQGCVVAAFVMSRPDEERELAEQWIRAKQRVAPERLADASRPLL